MAYDTRLADRIREYLFTFPEIKVEEKEMFRGLAFMVNGKLCVCVSGENMMCRFDPVLQESLAEKAFYQPMMMKGKELSGYCYINPGGLASKQMFEYWIRLCLDFNSRAKSSKKKKP